MRAAPEAVDARTAAGSDVHEWTADGLRDVLAPLVGQSHDIVVAVDEGPAMSIWAPTVDDFIRALAESGVFGSVTVCALGVDDSGRVTLRGSDGGDPLDLTGSGRCLLLALTDAVDPTWRLGGAWAALRDLGAAHSVAVVSPLSWWAACRIGTDLHRLRLKAVEPGAPNHFHEWEPQVDVPGMYDDLGDVVAVSFVELAPAALREWATLAAATGGPTWARPSCPPSLARRPGLFTGVKRRSTSRNSSRRTAPPRRRWCSTWPFTWPSRRWRCHSSFASSNSSIRRPGVRRCPSSSLAHWW